MKEGMLCFMCKDANRIILLEHTLALMMRKDLGRYALEKHHAIVDVLRKYAKYPKLFSMRLVQQ